MAKETKNKSYQEMLTKVETLVDQVADPDLDLDAMVARVEEGYGLIREMRTRLESTQLKVEALRQEYEDLGEGSAEA